MKLSPIVQGLTLGIFTLTGCSQFHGPAEAPEPATVTIEAPAPKPVVTRPFPVETLYALLVAEFAGSRERYDIALGNYLQQAHTTRDPGVAARAARIANFLNVHQATLNSALLWAELEPDNNEAHFLAASELARDGQLTQALQHSMVLLDNNSAPIFQTIAARAAQSTDIERENLVTEYAGLLQQHPDNIQLLIGMGLLLQQQNQLEKALSYSQQALTIDPQSSPAVILEAKLLHQLGRTQEAVARLGQQLNAQPDNERLRLQYARLLASFDLKEAYQQFELLTKQHPDDPDLAFSLALVSLEVGRIEEATALFESLTQGSPHRNAAYYYLGQIALKNQDPEAALVDFQAVESGPDFISAQRYIMDIYLQQNRQPNAANYLQGVRKQQPEQAEILYILEADALAKYNRLDDALHILNEGLQQFPGSTRLLYSRAMVHEQHQQPALAEGDLRTVLTYDPNNATALNALGYTLSNQSAERLPEAFSLIKQALSIKPDDPAIIDSMGWIHFRMGNYEEALIRLKQAMKLLPDPEIAAHLGEVLWVLGFKDDAKEVWQQGMKIDPDSPIIRATILRLTNN